MGRDSERFRRLKCGDLYVKSEKYFAGIFLFSVFSGVGMRKHICCCYVRFDLGFLAAFKHG